MKIEPMIAWAIRQKDGTLCQFGYGRPYVTSRLDVAEAFAHPDDTLVPLLCAEDSPEARAVREAERAFVDYALDFGVDYQDVDCRQTKLASALFAARQAQEKKP